MGKAHIYTILADLTFYYPLISVKLHILTENNGTEENVYTRKPCITE